MNQELNETVSRSRVVVEEVDGRLQQEYDCRLKDALVDMREENEEQLRKMREETEALFARKVVYIRSSIKFCNCCDVETSIIQ